MRSVERREIHKINPKKIHKIIVGIHFDAFDFFENVDGNK
jgi:hypothetical protein